MRKTKYLVQGSALAILAMVGGGAIAQSAAPAADLQSESSFIDGYVPSASPQAAVRFGIDGKPLPAIDTGNELDTDKVDAFNQTVRENFMGPELTRALRAITKANEQAMHERATPAARLDKTLVNLEPGETLTNVKVTPGNVTTLGFYDLTGEPWPVDHLALGLDEAFSVEMFPKGSHNMVITPKRSVGTTNISVRLKDFDQPVNVELTIDEAEYHATLNVQVASMGPNAADLTIEPKIISEAGSNILLAVLANSGLPAEAKRVEINMQSTMAWLYDGDMYIRSRHELRIPRAIEYQRVGPWHAYKLKPASALAFHQDGQYVHVTANLR